MERQHVVRIITKAMELGLLSADELTKRQAMAISGRPMMTFADAESVLKQAEHDLASELIVTHVQLHRAMTIEKLEPASCKCGHRFHNDSPMSDGRCRYCHEDDRSLSESRDQWRQELRRAEQLRRRDDDWRDPGVLYS